MNIILLKDYLARYEQCVRGDGFGATDLFFEWDLGLTVFAGGMGEEQLIKSFTIF